VLRRKLARFAADNAGALKDAQPIIPSDLINRDAANWWLLLAVAELAGGEWPKRARDAAERLTRRGRRPSDGVQLLAAFKDIFATGRKEITSENVVAELHKDPTSIWAEYKHGGPITQRQVAHLLDAFDIDPVVVHPTKRSNSSPRGYKASQFVDALTRFYPPIRTSAHGCT
jgi:putative DNA primase/helicase